MVGPGGTGKGPYRKGRTKLYTRRLLRTVGRHLGSAVFGIVSRLQLSLIHFDLLCFLSLSHTHK